MGRFRYVSSMQLKSLLPTNRKQIIIAGAVVLAILGGSIAGAAIYSNEQDRLATIAQAEADAKTAKKAEEMRVQKLEDDLADARSEGEALLDTARTRHEASLAFAVPAALERLTGAIEQLEIDLAEGVLSTIKKSVSSVRRQTDALGTVEDALDRQYIATLADNGDSASDIATSLRIARSECEDLDPHYADNPMGAVSNFVENRLFLDVDAITIFCPEYLPAVAVASTSFDDGNYVVTAKPSPMGTFGSDIKQGTYRTGPKESNCYWERTDRGGSTIDNGFATFAADGVTVTIYSGEGFVSDGCGIWTRQ